MSMKPRILIAGSAGFIGSSVMRSLNSLGVEVWGVDNYSPYYSPSMKHAREKALDLQGLTINADICDRVLIRKIFEDLKPDIVINMAAQGGVRASKTDPWPYLLSNQIGFLNLIENAKNSGVSKFIYASSSSVYGDTALVPFKESSSLSAPKSLYALSKLSNEVIAQNFDSPDMAKIGLRFFTVYGPWGRPDMAMFRILASSVLGKEFVLTASKDVERDFTFIEDLSRVIEELTIKEISLSNHEIINVAGGKPHSLSQLFSILESKGMPLKIISSEPDSLDVKLTHGSVEKLYSLNLPVPNSPLVYGVEKTLEWIEKVEMSSLNDWYEYNS